MLEFKKITLENKQEIESYLAKGDFKGAEYNFSHLYLWSQIYPMEYATYNGMMAVYAYFDKPGYNYPVGDGSADEMIEALILDAKERGNPFLLRAITGEDVTVLKENYPERFNYDTTPDYYDYVYLREKLATLSGKKLHSKRNHINYFMEHFANWSYEKITEENLPEVLTMHKEWNDINSDLDDSGLDKETKVVDIALHHYEELGLRGGLLRAEGNVVGFSLGRPISKDTFGVHIEKAFYDIRGAYPMLNQQYILHETEGYTYINREEDTGDLGLRKAKQSYQPVFMVERYVATLK